MNEENTQEQAATEAAQAPAETPAETTQHQETPEATEQHPATQEQEATRAALQIAAISMELGVEALAECHAEIDKLRAALENCRLLAAKRPKEEWARHILRFCESADVTGSPLRG